MSSTPARESYDAIVRQHIAPMMKAAGFTKSGTQWRLRGHFAWGVVNMQKSSYSSRDDISFTMNLGVRFDGLHQAMYPNAKHMWDQPPDCPSCHAQQRIGHFLPQPHDRWWNIVDDRDVPMVTAELIPLLQDHALPWVVRTMNDATLAAQYEDDYRNRRGAWSNVKR